MPLSINVGLSRKASRDYQSQGQSINVTAELDQSLLARPAELQQQIAGLYQQAQIALDQAANGTGDAPAPAERGNGHAQSTSNGKPNGRQNGHTNGTTQGPLLTASQRRAIVSITQRRKLDAETACWDEFGCPIDELTVRQASTFIDLLLSPSAGARKAGAR